MILRIRTGGNFTMVNNQYLRDENLSWKAKGILTYLMSLPDDFNINIQHLSDKSKNSRDAVSTGFKELIKEGYCERWLHRNEDGKIDGHRYRVCDIKLKELPFTENPVTDNPTLIKTINSKDYTNTKGENSDLFGNSKSLHFEESPLNDIETFKKVFSEQEDSGIDLDYYYHSVKGWAADLIEKDDKRQFKTAKGWKQTAENFMRRDKKEGKLVSTKKADSANKKIYHSL